jgi:hypothetical protein
MFVLNFLTKQEIEDKFFSEKTHEVIDYLLKKVLFSQPELLPEDKDSSIQITKEFLETWVAQGIGLTKKGAGSYPIDCYSKELNFAIDVKFTSMSLKKNGKFDSATNESSLLQNFKIGGKKLDGLFEDQKRQEILDLWINLMKVKLGKVKEDLNLDDIYYFCFIRRGDFIHLAVPKLNLLEVDNLTVDLFPNKLDKIGHL